MLLVASSTVAPCLHLHPLSLPAYGMCVGLAVCHPACTPCHCRRLFDELLDAAQEQADADEVAAQQQSLGEAVDRALQAHLAAASHGNGAAAAEASGEEQQQQQQPAADSGAAGPAVGKEQPAGGDDKDGGAAAGGDGNTTDATVAVPGGGGGAAAAEQAAGSVSSEQLMLLGWHSAYLEYGCSAPLSALSLTQWNQDEDLGGFGGPHAMVVGGFSSAVEGLASALGDALRLNTPVVQVEHGSCDAAAAAGGDAGQIAASGDDTAAPALPQSEQHQQQQRRVRVTTASGEVLDADVVLMTLPLGCLKAGDVSFKPPLPAWKADAVSRLGYGNLVKVLLQVCLDMCQPHSFTQLTHPACD